MENIIDSIIRFENNPIKNDNKGEDYYAPMFRGLGVVKETFNASYTINFDVPLFSSKVKYYKRLIDNTIAQKLNKEFSTEDFSISSIVAYHRKTLYQTVHNDLLEIKNIILKNDLDLDAVLTMKDYSKTPLQNECTYIFHYLILSLIRAYMEFQQHYIEQIDANKIVNIEDFFVQVLQWKTPDKVGVSLIPKIEIVPKTPKEETQIKKKTSILSFTYKKLQSESSNINTLFIELKKHKAIPQDFSITEFKHLFSGVEVAHPIKWIGYKDDLSYLFKLLVNKEKVLALPDNTTIWDIVDNCFVDADGNHFGKEVLRKQHKPKTTAKDIEHFAYLMT